MGIELSGGFEDGFLDLVADQLESCREELSDLDLAIIRLQEQRADCAKRVSLLEEIVNRSESADSGISSSTGKRPNPGVKPPRPFANADTVVGLICERGEAMHYLDIHETLVARGFEIGGKGNPDTLLSRFFDDERLVRVARGTYGLSDRQVEETAATQPVDEAVKVEAKPLRLHRARLELPLPPVKLSRSMNLAEMAAEVLHRTGKPLHYQKITEQILNSGAWKPITKTPGASVNSAMVIDIQKNETKSQFVRTGRGVYALREWEGD